MGAPLLEVEGLTQHFHLASGWLAGSGGLVRAPAVLRFGERQEVACHLYAGESAALPLVGGHRS